MMLDKEVYSGCDTIWKCFKRTAWLFPHNPFLGTRVKTLQIASIKQEDFGEYKWLTYKDIDIKVEAFSTEIIKMNLCPIIPSDTEGTPDLKFMGIFSENRPEWIVAELACCSDSICIVPLVNQNEFANENTVKEIIEKTQLKTVCASNNTVDFIFKLKKQGHISSVTNIVMFD